MSHESLREFALSRHGVVTTEETLQHIKRHQLHYLVESKVVSKAHPKVWLFNFVKKDWEQSAYAAMRSLPSTATLSRSSAAKWWGFGNFENPTVTVALPRKQRGMERDFTIVQSEIPTSQRLVRSGIWVTTIVRTVIDLAAELEQQHMQKVFDEVLFKKLVSASQIESLARSVPSHTVGLRKVRHELARRNETDRRLMSRFEREVVALLRRKGLPEPTGQFKVIYDNETYFPDFCWPEFKVIVEVNGGHHDDPVQLRKDRLRSNRLQSMGWVILAFGDETVTEVFIQQLRNLLQLRAG